MKKTTNNLLTMWRSLATAKPPYILECDKVLMKENKYHLCNSYNEYISDENFGLIAPTKFHLGLLPIPYAGNILKATIYILTLNPGFGPHDYFAESRYMEFRQEKINGLQQKNLNKEYPWGALNPAFCWHGGWKYWTGRLMEIIKVLTDKGYSFIKALQFLSRRVAILEYVPYHSKRFRMSRSILEKMETPKVIKAFVHEYVVPKAEKDKAIIIATRHSDMWELPRHKNIVIYNSVESRAAYLNLKSKGGKKIAEHLGLQKGQANK